jgi:hypothetical protein
METVLPEEVELIFDVMPCNALRVAQQPLSAPHPCSYFRKWGTYNSYDYVTDGAPQTPGIVQETAYVGKAFLLPEVLSGCRKAPIMALGINPNLPAFWPAKRNSIYPLFDDYKQYAHYFRYRSTAKLEIPENDFAIYTNGNEDSPFSDFELNVPVNANGGKIIPVQLQDQEMYLTYQGLLTSLAAAMNWDNHKLSLGEDISYGNMVACASAKWTTSADPANPLLPPMTMVENKGIVNECFFKRKHFVRQLFQSLPKIILIFSQTTANAFISTFKNSFIEGDPQVNESLNSLLNKKIVLRLSETINNEPITTRVIFSPHATGSPHAFALARKKVIAQLVNEAETNSIKFNAATRHLARTMGACTFCTMMDIGKCDYANEIKSIVDGTAVHPLFAINKIVAEKSYQHKMISNFENLKFVPKDWQGK